MQGDKDLGCCKRRGVDSFRLTSSWVGHRCGRANLERWTVEECRQFMAQGESETSSSALRQCTHSGRPLGSAEFVAALERSLLRPLDPRKGGRPKKPLSDAPQMSVSFVA